MKKITIDVPSGIRFISDWEGFCLPEIPCIIDKQITGCGFTEWCIRNNQNTILVSPRLILLENKEEQHRGKVFYARNDLDEVLNVDRDLTKSLSTVKKTEYEQEKLKCNIDINKKKSDLRKQIRNYVISCMDSEVPCKILVTYDSYRLVYETLVDMNCFAGFHTVVDEFQSIFTDSRFKSDTELGFLSILQNVQKLCFVSATPTIDTYLEMLDEFRDLPYYEMRWETLDPGRVIKPQIEIHPCKRLNDIAIKIIQDYLNGNFEKAVIKDDFGKFKEIESRELVIYVNSVKNICDIIRKAGLTFNNTNVLCSSSPTNQKKVRAAFGLGKGDVGGIGKVPLKDEPRKMFTLCTRTVYLGADFYSDCARSIILSDANIECLAVDITLDLPQILGRQRLDENPWKNRATLYAKFLSEGNRVSVEDFKNHQKIKLNRTENLLLSYNTSPTKESKFELAKTFQFVAKSNNYKDDYISVNTHEGNCLVPVVNHLVLVSEIRAFEIQQIDFADRFRMLNVVKSTGKVELDSTNEVSNFINRFNYYTRFTDKMRFLCETELPESILSIILTQIPIKYSTFYNVLGPERIKAFSYRKSDLELECSKLLENQTGSIKEHIILSNFFIGERITVPNIKNRLKTLYQENSIVSSPKAVDLLDYFEIKKTKVKNEEGKFIDGYEILSIKKKD